ncbi:glycine--tRNA ligase subunit beta [Companilactobacillus alimentarius]|uniref:Glycine--tRNA ligase beta subunit n=1 Tax=Companilactobacillus alimentarius DSM 20249 TaxID=1423720 RepID=A0A2K9HMJ8_9LACO|nr:glycine--tRNA ligase subunit beta [Companilactobacillus alimentarius]AUI71263.1 glycine--tRNA ligase subunit beta [Companilactobacillus alimentarius DSM 20249]KRK75400.1 glycyl-tRNA synthetase subunit beta [Companilactobacillus alimentarius DSM 20249]MDT6951459.1 glycine--tRNA ligase subunit beta [Companilactobacillus alimentarius]GEO43816.1 glycine--tRNA ligase beta subunit [Companilactobacillus alimentarius]
MTKNYLLEIGLEEMPAHVVTKSVEQFAQRTEKFLKENRISFNSIEKFSTPRRLTIFVKGIADKQTDIDIKAKGPSKKIAQDADGNWTKAAQGFARGQKMTPDDIFFEELKGTEYAYIQKHEDGQKVEDILSHMDEVIKSITFPTRMRWGSYDFEYIRPIHWLVSLLDNEEVPVKVLDIKSGRMTRGHRFLGEDIEIDDAKNYVEKLKSQFVIVDASVRKQMISDQIDKIAKDNDWDVDVDPDLLEEVNNLVEYPTTFYGSFDKKYLEIPDEVLITSMKDNQRYFYVRDQNGELAPYFIGVRNGNSEHIENVVRGNEKVLVARLEDADFFFKEDQKKTIADYVEKLKSVNFHVKIGTMYEKMARVHQIAEHLADIFDLSETEKKDLLRASDIYKFDLVTSMVDEFSELQGVMGEKYAEIMGETKAVAQAIREHYMPISSEGALPKSKVGAALAIADKIDSIVTFFAVDLIPSGSNDPYALRRQAYGIVRILNQYQWSLNFDGLQNYLEDNVTVPAKLDLSKHTKDIDDFMIDRVRQLLKKDKIRVDIIDAVAGGSNVDPIVMIDVAKVLQNHVSDDDFKIVMEALGRIVNLSKKAKFGYSDDLTVDDSLFENPSEAKLKEQVAKINNDNAEDLFKQLAALRPTIDSYFDENMIMAKDEKVKNNRLTQLVIANHLIANLGDLSKVITK